MQYDVYALMMQFAGAVKDMGREAAFAPFLVYIVDVVGVIAINGHCVVMAINGDFSGYRAFFSAASSIMPLRTFSEKARTFCLIVCCSDEESALILS